MSTKNRFPPLMWSPLSGTVYLVKRARSRGGNNWEASQKEPANEAFMGVVDAMPISQASKDEILGVLKLRRPSGTP